MGSRPRGLLGAFPPPSLSYSQGAKVLRKIPEPPRNCCRTVLEPLTSASGILGTFFNSSSGMWVIKGHAPWAELSSTFLPGVDCTHEHTAPRSPLCRRQPCPLSQVTFLHAPFHRE